MLLALFQTISHLIFLTSNLIVCLTAQIDSSTTISPHHAPAAGPTPSRPPPARSSLPALPLPRPSLLVPAVGPCAHPPDSLPWPAGPEPAHLHHALPRPAIGPHARSPASSPWPAPHRLRPHAAAYHCRWWPAQDERRKVREGRRKELRG
ncbi:unnamed protein product [Urochloa humidicola]